MNYLKRYQNKLNEPPEDMRNPALDDFIAFTAVQDFVDDSNNDVFDLCELEKIYIEKLAERGRIIESHITRFASLAGKAGIGLSIVQPSDGGKYRAFRTTQLMSMIPDSDWVQNLRSVIEPVRHEIFAVHDMDKPEMSDLSTRNDVSTDDIEY